MEASALRAPAVARPHRGAPLALMRLRSDEQLVAQFRDGSDEAFRVIYERYRARLFAYARQMLSGSRQDAEDALQDVFVRAYRHLRASDRPLLLRPWLYRVAHNRCVDVLRRPVPPSAELLEVVRPPSADPLAEAELREDLRQLVRDVRRLPEHQRSALLMRELEGFAYGDIAGALDVTVPAVKSLLVRARIGLAQAEEARESPCGEIREQLALARDHGVRASGRARRHLHDCSSCRDFRRELRSVERSLASFAPALGPVALVAKLLGIGASSSGAAAGAASTGGAVASGGAGAATAAGSTFAAAAASKVVAVVAVAAVATGGAAVEHELRAAPAASAPAPRLNARLVAPVTSAPARSVVAVAPPSPAPTPPAAHPVVRHVPAAPARSRSRIVQVAPAVTHRAPFHRARMRPAPPASTTASVSDPAAASSPQGDAVAPGTATGPVTEPAPTAPTTTAGNVGPQAVATPLAQTIAMAPASAPAPPPSPDPQAPAPR